MELEAVPRATASQAFESFYNDQREGLLTLMHALCRSTGRGEVEDLVQEAFVRAYLRWNTISSFDRPDLWVRRVAVNLSISRYRRLQTEARRLVRLAGPPDDTARQLRSDTLAVLDAIRRLPARQAQVLALTYIDQLTTAEVAEVLGIAEGTVRTNLRRGLSRLRDDPTVARDHEQELTP